MQGRVIAVVGHKDTGKTRVVEGLVRYLTGKGFTVGTVKHVHGRVALEPSGTDSARHLEAGAERVVTASDRMLLVTAPMTAKGGRSPGACLDGIVSRYFGTCDCVIVEGFKQVAATPKVVVTANGEMPRGLANVVACVYRRGKPRDLPAFRPDETSKLGDFLLKSGTLTPAGDAVHLVVDGKTVAMNEFVGRALAGVVEGFVGSLRGVKHPRRIEIAIRPRRTSARRG